MNMKKWNKVVLDWMENHPVWKLWFFGLSQREEKCTHETAIVLESIENFDFCQCTWVCGKKYWTITENGMTREITS